MGADLIVAAIHDFARGTVKETAQTGPGKLFKNPPPEQLLQLKKLLATRRKGAALPYCRPRWKLSGQVDSACAAAGAEELEALAAE